MTENVNNEYFTKKHARLFDLARLTSIAAWVVLIYQLVSLVISIINWRMYFFTGDFSFTKYHILRVLTNIQENFLDFFDIFIGEMYYLIKGIGFFLLLKGISLGLYMVLETNLNYKDKFEEVGNE
jgi:hypothetical protein